MRNLAFVFICLVLTACSGLSKEQCQTADWEALGFEDGLVGKGLEQMADYRQNCTEYGVQMDAERYQFGRNIGLEEFCQPASAYQAGRKGYVYKGVCPAVLEEAFAGPYEEGRTVYLAERELQRAKSDYSNAESRLGRVERDIRNRESVLLNDKTSSDERRHVYNELEDLKREAYRLKDALRNLDRDIYHAKRELEEVQLQYGR